jgi:alpha-beta hydrolase superfamily lysophospholipase
MTLRALKHLVYFLGYGVLTLVIALVVVYRWHLSGLPELKIWHTAALDVEFRAQDAGRIRTIADYRALEERLLAQLTWEVYDRLPPEDRRRFNRYSSGSVSDPAAQPFNWNRTFELPAAEPRAGVLLLHGLSDSPYSVRALAEHLHARGYHVVGLRVPGHGTAPSALVHTRWQDMAAAVRLAARDLSQRLGAGKKLHMIGYSNGAALAVEYALSRLQGEALPPVERLVLISPAIGVSPAAAFAVWLGRLSTLLRTPKLAWTDVVPEYDPYKYGSFPVNAADQSYALTQVIAARMAALGKSGGVTGLPRMLAFQSVADDTVSTPAVVQALFRLLAPEGHELILFDINRYADAAELYLPGIPEVRERLIQAPPLTFDLRVLTNSDSTSNDIAVLHKKAVTGELSATATAMKWPHGVFSLSHVALPFSPDDPIYGAAPPRERKGPYLGLPEVRGERRVLAVSPGSLIRLRHNPFFDYLLARTESFLLEGSVP